MILFYVKNRLGANKKTPQKEFFYFCTAYGIPPRSDSEPGRYTQKARICSLSTRALRIPFKNPP